MTENELIKILRSNPWMDELHKIIEDYLSLVVVRLEKNLKRNFQYKNELTEKIFFHIAHQITDNPEKYFEVNFMESLLINSEPNRKLKSKNDIIKLLESFLFTLYTAIHFFNPKEIISEKEILLNTIKKKGNELNILEGKIELYEKLLQTREEQRKKEIDSLLKTFIAYCEEYDCSSPTLPNLSKYSGVSLEVWKNKFGISQNADFVVARSFIELLLSGIKKKGNYNKRNRDKMLFWNEVFEKIETRLKKIQNKLKTDMTQMKMVEYSEKIDNRYTVKKKKRSEPDKKKTINYLDNEEKLCIECKERYAYENGICKVCWNEQYPTRNTI